MQHRFLQYVNRIDDKQALLDTFVWKFNAFSEEYPDMRKQDLTKEELHQQSDDLHDLLQKKVNDRKTENMAELENITTSQWVESHIQVLAAQVQVSFRLEAQRYHSSCQLLSDFYHGAIGAGFPEAGEPCPKIEALSPDENGVAPKERLRVFVPMPTGEGGVPVEGAAPAHWDFPFVEDLMTQAQVGLFKPIEWCLPANFVKAEEVVDPKAKAKAKGKAAPDKPKKGEVIEEAKPVETPPLFVDLQQALLAERVHYQYRLSVIRDWALRRLLQATEASENLYVQLRDWVMLRRKKELDSCLDLVDVIKEHIESEDLIKAKLTLKGAHLHRHPNVHLQAEFVPEEPPVLESGVPYRWTISQLDHLLETVSGAARALRPNSLVLPSQALLGVLIKLTQAPSAEGGAVEQALVPVNWRPCDIERLQSLCSLFDPAPRSGTVDGMEFLLSIGIHHSPLGWPSADSLKDLRAALQNEVPADCSWPDFYITEDVLSTLPLFQDTKGEEADLAGKFPWETTKKPAPFDRCGEQMRWLVGVVRNFKAAIRQQQAYELEVDWWEHMMRVKDEDKVNTKLLDDNVSGNSTPIAQVTPPVGRDGDAPSLTHSPAGTSEDAAPLPPPGPPPRPTEPSELPVPPKGAVSVRQLMTFLCLGTTLEDGLTRAVTMMGPPGANASTPIPLVDLHAILLQLGARVTPPSLEGDGRPRHPSVSGMCKELGIDNSSGEAAMSVADFVRNAQAQKLCNRLGFARRHCRPEVEKLFPKNLQPGAKILPNQRLHVS